MKYRKKVLILGGEGFVGRNLADLLSLKYECYSADVKKTPFFKKNRRDKFLKINPYRKKINNDYDIIIHLIDNGKSGKLFKQNEQNLIKNINLNKNNYLIIFSSAAVYANPSSDYAKRKIILEKIYKDFCKKKNIKLAIVRLFNVYGKYQLPGKQGSLVANVFCNYFNQRRTMINDMDAKRNFVYSCDMAKFIQYLIENSFFGTIDLCGKNLTSIKNLIALIKKAIGKEVKIENKRKKDSVINLKGRNNLANKLKWTPLGSGLKKTCDFYSRNIGIINKIQENYE